MRTQLSWLASAALLASACGSPSDKPDSISTASRTSPAAAAPAQAPVTKKDWVVNPTGIGPLVADMSLSEAKAVVGGLSSSEDLASAPCTYAHSSQLPSGTIILFEKGEVARVDVLTGSVRTREGAGIGDSEARLKSLYGKRIVTTPHKYTDGHYLTVTSPSDSTRKIVFETDGAKVLRFRAGRTPAVEYVEGCG